LRIIGIAENRESRATLRVHIVDYMSRDSDVNTCIAKHKLWLRLADLALKQESSASPVTPRLYRDVINATI